MKKASKRSRTSSKRSRTSSKKAWSKPSAYRSAHLVSERKNRTKNSGLGRWLYEEKWVNLTPWAFGRVSQIKDSPDCGDSSKNPQGQKSVCRPLHKASKRTPKTASSFSKKQVKKAVMIKNRGERIDWNIL